MEGVRGDFIAVLGPLSLPQVFSLIFILVGVGIWLGLRLSLSAGKSASKTTAWFPKTKRLLPDRTQIKGVGIWD